MVGDGCHGSYGHCFCEWRLVGFCWDRYSSRNKLNYKFLRGKHYWKYCGCSRGSSFTQSKGSLSWALE
ncbi:hypothetical protein Pfo_018275 [Paulownia fortunei]|nr:hypothetical protein Pfo_018275 [Paulownia fortunei]